ncbi:hypothetical protein LINGRAHAP2_LOCUS28860 [Linum grandiflorum]
MFDFLLRSFLLRGRIKRTVKKLVARMSELRNERQAMVRHSKEVVDIALDPVEQVVKDEQMVELYELLESFCDVISESKNLSYILMCKCRDLPELQVIRKFAEDRYGERFGEAAGGVFPGNIVNRQVRENLTVRPDPEDVKLRLADKIARENLLLPEIAEQDKLTSEIQVMHDDDDQKLKFLQGETRGTF